MDVSKVMLAVVVLAGCGFQPSHKGEPQTCRERTAFKLASAYPNPNDLTVAVEMVCEGTGPFIPPTTTRPP